MLIGRTRGGEEISIQPGQSPEHFVGDIIRLDEPDVFDVYCMSQWLVIKSKRKHSEKSPDYGWWVLALRTLERFIGTGRIERMILESGLESSGRMVQEGKKMAMNFFRDY